MFISKKKEILLTLYRVFAPTQRLLIRSCRALAVQGWLDAEVVEIGLEYSAFRQTRDLF